MAYAILADVKKRISADTLLELTDEKEVGSIDEVLVADMIKDADAVIDSYLRGRYTVPLGTPISPFIVRISADLAIVNLTMRNGEMNDEFKQRYDTAISSLRDFQSGKALLDVTPEAEEIASSKVRTNKTRQSRIWSEDFLDQLPS